MRVRILYFAAVRELVGLESEDVDLPEGTATVGAFLGWLERHCPSLAGRLDAVRVARNETFAKANEPIAAGDDLAVIPPVAGG